MTIKRIFQPLLQITLIVGVGLVSLNSLKSIRFVLSSDRILTQQPTENHSSPLVEGKTGMVVTTQHEASKIGLNILKQGGNAIDAAVAVGYALAVSDPCCGNLGGGGFMLIHFADGRQTFINFREKAPLKATQTLYLDDQGRVIPKLSQDGYLAVAVPGTVKGLEYALSKYGTLKRSDILQPAIELAEKGFILQSGDIDILEEQQKRLQDPSMAAIFLKEGKMYQVGDRLIQKDLAKTLNLIAKEGEKGFYKGIIAEKVVNSSQEKGGILSLEDFAQYSIQEQSPIQCHYRGYRVISAPPPGGGVTVCQMLNILAGYDLKGLGWQTPESLHRMFAAMLYAYSDRNTYLGDPNYVNIPIDKLLSLRYAEDIRAQIPANQAIPPEKLGQTPIQEGQNTTHYSIVDQYGNAVAVTYTINTYFGAGVIASDTGFILNNEMDDFTSKLGNPNQFGLVQGKANQIEPGKRPLSSMSPTIVLQNHQPVLITGSPGGSTIPTTVLQVITNTIDYGMNIEQAVNSPRIHYQGLPNFVWSEPKALSSTVVQQLEKMGYKVKEPREWGAAESISIDPKTGVFHGANDRRKPAGSAMGF